MKDDIRVIKQLGIITSGEGNWQKELNIVSVNNGPFRYDLREWSLDHSSFRNGISFENEEAQVLLAVLKECFKDGGEGISIEAYPAAQPTEKPAATKAPVMPAEEPLSSSDDALYALLKEQGIEFIDKRDKGGALWIVGGHEYDSVMEACGKLGYKFYYSEKGGRITKGKPGWYLPAKSLR